MSDTPKPNVAQRDILQLGITAKVRIKDGDRGGYFAGGAGRRLRTSEVDACVARGWLEPTGQATMRTTQAGHAALGLSVAQSTAIQRRIDNGASPTPPSQQVIR